ncbi:MAG: MFS transporter [Acidimicrobiales bacterium]
MTTSLQETGSLSRPFWALWWATTVSSLGDGVALVALPLLAVFLTHSALLVSAVVTVQTLPWLLVALPAGAVVDRMSPARAMAAADLARAGVMAALVGLLAAGDLSIGVLYGLAFLLGVFETVYVGGAQSAIPQLVEGDGRSYANGLLIASETAGGHLAGPALGGIVFALGRVIPFAADGASFLASAGLVGSLRRRLPAPPRAQRSSLRADMAAGLTFFRRSPLLKILAMLTAGLAFFQAMVLAPLVVFALRDLHLSETGYGIFLGMAAVGSIAGSLLAPKVRAHAGTGTILTAAGFLAAAAYLAMSATSSPVVADVAFVAEALAVACGSVASITLRQQHIPQALMGRVSNIFRTAIWGSIPVGALLGGVLAGDVGLRSPMIVAGALQIALVLATALPMRRTVRGFEAPPGSAPAPPGPTPGSAPPSPGSYPGPPDSGAPPSAD